MSFESTALATVVVCEADEETLTLLCDRLTADRFAVLPASGAAEALRLCHYDHPDLLVLDATVPDGAALDAVRRIREADGIEDRLDPRLPIIALVDRGGADRRLQVEAGVDDCVSRPFTYDEVRARITAVLRRRHSRHDDPVRVGELVVDSGRRKVTVGGREVHLARREFTLLRVLASDPTRVFGKDELLRDVWGLRAPAGRTRTLDSHASRLRRKLDPEHRRYVVNCWGIGYSLVSDRLEVGR
ncbi:MAG TPA: response regulator transcription factor [Solirubrobacterales bacterium]